MTAPRKPIVVVGSINMDLVAHTHQIPVAGQTVIGTGFDTTPGGKGANQAVAAARLGYSVKMLGAVGRRRLRPNPPRQPRRPQASTLQPSPASPAPPALLPSLVSDSGQNIIVVVPGANGKMDIRRHRPPIRAHPLRRHGPLPARAPHPHRRSHARPLRRRQASPSSSIPRPPHRSPTPSSTRSPGSRPTKPKPPSTSAEHPPPRRQRASACSTKASKA